MLILILYVVHRSKVRSQLAYNNNNISGGHEQTDGQTGGWSIGRSGFCLFFFFFYFIFKLVWPFEPSASASLCIQRTADQTDSTTAETEVIAYGMKMKKKCYR